MKSESASASAMGVLPGARVSLVLLLLINLFNYIDRQVLAAVEPLIAAELFPHVDGKPSDPNEELKMGLLATAFLVSYMLTAPLFGWLGDRWKRWALIGIGVLLWTVASGASGLVKETEALLMSVGIGSVSAFVVLLVTRMFVGVGEGAYGPIAPAVISDMYPVSRRGKVLAWFYVAIPVGSALGYVLGGLVGGHFGWRWAFYSVVPPGIALAVWCFFRADPPRGRSEGEGGVGASRQARWADYLVLLRTPSYVLNVAGMTAMTFAIGGVSFWMPRYIAVFRKAGELSDVNLIFGAITVVAGLGATLAGGWAGDRLRTRLPGAYLLVSGTAMLVGFPLFLAVLVTPFPLCWVVIFLACFALFFNTGPSNTAIANVAHPALRATAYAVCILVIHALGDAISPPLIGKVNGLAGGNMNVGFGVVSGAFLMAGVFWLWGARHLGRDTAAAPTRLAD